MLDENKAKKEFQGTLNSFKINTCRVAKSNVLIGIKLRMFIYYFIGIK